MKTTMALAAALVLAACSREASSPGDVPAASSAKLAATAPITATVTSTPPASDAARSDAMASAPSAAVPDARVATTKPFVPSFPLPPFKGKFPHAVDPSVNEAGRVVDVVYAGPGTDTEGPLFKLLNRSGKALVVSSAWVFYYDASDRRLHRAYASSVGRGIALEAGETKEQRLGDPLKELKPGIVTSEGEVTGAIVAGEPWFNENLTEERPRGGASPDALLAAAGERVIVEMYDLTSYKARLTNVTNRAVTETRVKVFYFDAKGDVARAVPTLEKVSLGPGKSVDVTLHPAFDSDKKPIGGPAKAVRAVAFAPTVTFADGTSFDNENLSTETRHAPK